MTQRFEFGKNWLQYLKKIEESHIEDARNSITKLLDISDLSGFKFCDVGSGSGIYSLAARSLGAYVYSFDYDKESVESTEKLKQLYNPNCEDWIIKQGSVLDKNYMSNLEEFDYVYSWGVLHHTGDLRQSLENIGSLVKANGYLILAIYNKQILLSSYWKIIKKLYVTIKLLRPFIFFFHLPIIFPQILRSFIFKRKLKRGMIILNDYIDWIGGYPFEVASREEVKNFYDKKGYKLVRCISVGRSLGCNEFVFKKISPC